MKRHNFNLWQYHSPDKSQCALLLLKEKHFNLQAKKKKKILANTHTYRERERERERENGLLKKLNKNKFDKVTHKNPAENKIPNFHWHGQLLQGKK